MKSIRAMFVSLCLSLLLAGTAFANDTQKVNINTADAATLARALHNVGQAKAEAIVAYRNENGPFKSAEQLAMVKGIGMRTVEQNVDRIEVGAAAARPAAARPKPAAPAAAAAANKGAAPLR
ncbi:MULTISPECIES: ComEA family DNA-binding protein [Luteimonas]|uniref:Competence protein ComEA n=1 Tax=Luteimonas chenhongjianii TaxID=2006110 RepID=A0A290XGA7_9GAMM|nr:MULTISPECIES: ComEA family DNA-binding protein [Luteimonas]ATD68185.1 competence protein ComEA [Luteimonas chenhongjianii]RPD88146.1 ComEA family DNA-binding protein [Luteimonas sp. 100069]